MYQDRAFKLMAKALKIEHQKEVKKCVRALDKQIAKFSALVGVEALEIVFTTTVAHLEDEELKNHTNCLRAKLKLTTIH